MKAFVLEELEKHLVPNSNRLRTFDDARLEFVTYAEAKFGSTIHVIQCRVNRRLEGLDDDAIILLHLVRVKERGHHVQETVVPCAAEAIFRETALFTQLPREGNGKKCKWSKPWSNSAGKEMSE